MPCAHPKRFAAIHRREWGVLQYRRSMSESQTKNCQNCKNSFIIEPDDFSFYEKIKVPPPTWCPECRLQRRLVWRNERALYKRKCGAPGHTEDIISYYPSDAPYTVYDLKYWWSDAWDAADYGQEYDFSRPFFAQFKELLDRVPHAALSSNYATMVNSDYSNWAGDCKNCYLVTDADYVEDSGYCSSIFKSKECYDSNTVAESELCYESFNVHKCYRTFYSVSCHESSDLWFSKGLVGCSHCFGCMDLRKKSYHIFNEPYSKDAYEQKMTELLGDRSAERMAELVLQAEAHWLKYPGKSMRGIQNVNSFGDYVYHSKNVRHGFFVDGAEDSKFVSLIHSPGTKDCFDYTDWGDNAQRVYESIACGLGVDNIKFSNLVVLNSKNATYSYWSYGCSDIFGCSDLRKKQYCILNKQYTKNEYEGLVPKIVKHMNDMPYIDARGRTYRYGEFFPFDLMRFAYNETMAQEIFPLTEERAKESGFPWRAHKARDYQITRSADSLQSQLYDRISHHRAGARIPQEIGPPPAAPLSELSSQRALEISQSFSTLASFVPVRRNGESERRLCEHRIASPRQCRVSQRV